MGTSDSGFRDEVESEEAIARGEKLGDLITSDEFHCLTGPARPTRTTRPLPRDLDVSSAERNGGGARIRNRLGTCALREVPHAWIRQARPGALILTPWGTHYSNLDVLLRLTVHGDGTASGSFLAPVEFMKLRSQRLTWPEPPGGGGTLAESSTATTPPEHGRHAAFTFLMGFSWTASRTRSSRTTTAPALCGCTR
ncbi:hypothetical protein ACFRAR_11345 [Kitasatospora sp. NPDC056651]|uniref:hypothetical protein n=1 Tax=Kitasatospora sp. NPDC056651 TaxID=3345892 RepID=UPI00368377C4